MAISKIFGVAIADIAKINGVAKASISSFGGEALPAGLGSELLTNTDFETNTTGWTAKDGAISYETTSPITGSGSLSFNNSTGNSDGGPYQNIGWSHLKTYRVSGNIKLVSGATSGNVMIKSLSSAGFSQFNLYTGPTLAVGATQAFTADVSPNVVTAVSVEIACNEANAVFLVDDLSVKEVL